MHVPQMPYICYRPKLLKMHKWGKHAYMLHINSLVSTIWPGVLYTDDNNVNADDDADVEAENNNDSEPWLHYLSWPWVKSTKIGSPSPELPETNKYGYQTENIAMTDIIFVWY